MSTQSLPQSDQDFLKYYLTSQTQLIKLEKAKASTQPNLAPAPGSPGALNMTTFLFSLNALAANMCADGMPGDSSLRWRNNTETTAICNPDRRKHCRSLPVTDRWPDLSLVDSDLVDMDDSNQALEVRIHRLIGSLIDEIDWEGCDKRFKILSARIPEISRRPTRAPLTGTVPSETGSSAAASAGSAVDASGEPCPPYHTDETDASAEPELRGTSALTSLTDFVALGSIANLDKDQLQSVKRGLVAYLDKREESSGQGQEDDH